MMERKRHHLILGLIEERSFVSVAELRTLLSASGTTIRRDIATLAEQGVIRRIRGGAESIQPHPSPTPASAPLALRADGAMAQKRAIARAAAALIASGESVVINGGTTTCAMVEFLADKDLDILTNSVPIATQLLATSCNRITMSGGTIFREQNIVLSPFENDTTEHFWGDKLFTGCYGINRLGLMEADPLIVHAQTKLLKRCDEVIVLADSSKLRQKSAMVVSELARISVVITDSDASAQDVDALRAAGTKVVIATVSVEDREHTGSTARFAVADALAAQPRVRARCEASR